MASYTPWDIPGSPSFVTKRSLGMGDYVRGPEGFRSVLRFGASLPSELGSGGAFFVCRPNGYDSVDLWWGVPPSSLGLWASMAVVRSGFGHPTSPSGGVIIHSMSDPGGDPEGNIPGHLLDTPLASGRWYYYSLMFMLANGTWHVVGKTQTVVPVNYRHSEHLYGGLPPFYQELDEANFAGTSNSALSKLFGVVGYDLDMTRTLAEGLDRLYDPDTSPLPLYTALGSQNFGYLENDAVNGAKMRSIIAMSRESLGRRGTLLGLEQYIASATKYETYVTEGTNLLLLDTDGSFSRGTGNWCPLAYGVATKLIPELPSPVAGPDLLPTRRLTMHSARSSADYDPTVWEYDRYPDAPSTMPTLPAELTQTLSRLSTVAVIEPNGDHLAISCGSGQRYQPYMADGSSKLTSRLSHLDVEYRGVPVDAKDNYYLSFYMTKDTGDASEEVIVWGFAWFPRDVPGNPFSDAFANDPTGMQSFITVEPDSVAVVFSSPSTATGWARHSMVATAPDNARFGIPIIAVFHLDGNGDLVPADNRHYVAAVGVTKQQGIGIESVYRPGIHLIVTDNVSDTDNVLGTDSGKVLGEDR